MALKTHSDSFGLNRVDSAQRGDSPTQFALLGGPPSRVNFNEFSNYSPSLRLIGPMVLNFPKAHLSNELDCSSGGTHLGIELELK